MILVGPDFNVNPEIFVEVDESRDIEDFVSNKFAG